MQVVKGATNSAYSPSSFGSCCYREGFCVKGALVLLQAQVCVFKSDQGPIWNTIYLPCCHYDGARQLQSCCGHEKVALALPQVQEHVKRQEANADSPFLQREPLVNCCKVLYDGILVEGELYPLSALSHTEKA